MAKKAFQRSVQGLLKHNKEGSFSTYANRCARISQIMRQLTERYPDLQDIRQLKTRHIDYLVERWQSENLSAGTIKNRMSDLRWIAAKIDKQNIVKRTNAEYDIARRVYTDNEYNAAKTLTDGQIESVSDRFVRMSLRLQREFGLRREEAIKFSPRYADQGDYIRLKDTWCKGGRAREIPLTNERQRALLDEIREFCREHKATALIPPERNYKQQLKAYENHTARNEIYRNHGLRHEYAQQRYFELTGWEAPKRGGMVAGEMTPQQREIDHLARLKISAELGHNREEITNVYLGGKKR